jgi:hypothetical protein
MNVVRYAVGLPGFGIAIGLWAAYVLSRFMQGILYEHPASELGGAPGPVRGLRDE